MLKNIDFIGVLLASLIVAGAASQFAFEEQQVLVGYSLAIWTFAAPWPALLFVRWMRGKPALAAPWRVGLAIGYLVLVGTLASWAVALQLGVVLDGVFTPHASVLSAYVDALAALPYGMKFLMLLPFGAPVAVISAMVIAALAVVMPVLPSRR